MRARVLLAAAALGAIGAPAVAESDVASVNAALREELVASFADAADKLVLLAEAIPAEKYVWRPSEGVRSVSEVAMHVASGSLYFSRLLGFPSELSPKDLEKETDKARVLDTLKRSIDHAKGAIRQLSDQELDRKRDFSGSMRSGRSVALLLVSHTHEHLGQLIAYARSSGTTPPWSS
jgi:uncharacterized damage-inducible protein DinB